MHNQELSALEWLPIFTSSITQESILSSLGQNWGDRGT